MKMSLVVKAHKSTREIGSIQTDSVSQFGALESAEIQKNSAD